MKYLFQNILGDFVLDNALDIVAEGKDVKKKYPHLKPLPEDKVAKALFSFKDQKYFDKFYQKNLELTKNAIKESVSADGLIIQTISNIIELERTCNLLTKRLREWYGLYFPELSKRVPDQERFIELVFHKSKKELMQDLKQPETMGADLTKEDVEEIILLAKQTHALIKLRYQHEKYLEKIMKKHCPNLLELAGVTIGAKLLELGKGLKHLAMLPASTIQLLGAEKALFRHLKTGSRSPKYGILLQHQLVQQAKPSLRGKMARMLADKISLCCRLDYFKGEFKAKEYWKELEGKL